MPHSQALFGIALITIFTARVIEWLLLMRACRVRSVATARQDCEAPTSDAGVPDRDRLSLVLLGLAWLGALSPPLLIAAGFWVRQFQE